MRSLRLELAADYLVMAAWLAYLKSRLLLPQASDGEEPTGEEMAAELAFRLRRLEAMRDAASRLANRDRLGRDVFARADPEPVEIVKRGEYLRHALRPAHRLCRQRQQTMASEAHRVAPARGLVAAGRARRAHPHDRPHRRMDADGGALLALSRHARHARAA